jgi:hypothetical protein
MFGLLSKSLTNVNDNNSSMNDLDHFSFIFSIKSCYSHIYQRRPSLAGKNNRFRYTDPTQRSEHP